MLVTLPETSPPPLGVYPPQGLPLRGVGEVHSPQNSWGGTMKGVIKGTRHSFAARLRQEKEAVMGRELAKEMGHGRVATTLKFYAPNGGRKG